MADGTVPVPLLGQIGERRDAALPKEPAIAATLDAIAAPPIRKSA
ncbi:hypothetical protein [Paracoccus sp. AK26]|nr:hypothetical protein [Paracoccus sp. AK26]